MDKGLSPSLWCLGILHFENDFSEEIEYPSPQPYIQLIGVVLIDLGVKKRNKIVFKFKERVTPWLTKRVHTRSQGLNKSRRKAHCTLFSFERHPHPNKCLFHRQHLYVAGS